MKKKVLFIINEMINGGGQRSLINLLEMMDYNRFEVDLLLFKEQGEFMDIIPEQVNLVATEKNIQYLFMNNINIIGKLKLLPVNLVHVIGTIFGKILSKSGYNKGQIRWKYFYKKIVPEMSKEYDVAISYLEGESLYYLVDKTKAKKKISFIHTDYSKINADEKFDAYYFSKVDSVVGISRGCVEILKSIFPEYIDKIIFLPNLVSSKSIYKQSEMHYPREYRNESEVILLSIGRLTKLKGFNLAIEAAKLLKEKGIKFKWFILGDGELQSELEKQIEKLNVSDCVELLGVRNNPYPYIKNATIIVQTSMYEGKSMVLDEAKILNKPIVVTRYDTVSDQISDDEGLIVDMNGDAIATGIEQMIQRREHYIQFLSKNEYGNQKLINEYYKVFNGEVI